jgi:hypothetical protein
MGDGELIKMLDHLLCIEGARKAVMPLSQDHGYQESLKLNAVNAVVDRRNPHHLLVPRHIEYPDVLPHSTLHRAPEIIGIEVFTKLSWLNVHNMDIPLFRVRHGCLIVVSRWILFECYPKTPVEPKSQPIKDVS